MDPLQQQILSCGPKLFLLSMALKAILYSFKDALSHRGRNIPPMKFHLKFIKWSLFVHSKASNIGCWVESWGHTLFFEACKLAIDYYIFA